MYNITQSKQSAKNNNKNKLKQKKTLKQNKKYTNRGSTQVNFIDILSIIISTLKNQITKQNS